MGRLSHKLTFGKDELPAACSWSAGDYHDEFTVTEATGDKLWVDLRPLGAPRLRTAPAGEGN